MKRGAVIALNILVLVLCLPIISLAEPLDNWNLRYDPSYVLQGVTFGNGLFVAVGEHGNIVSSPDGVTWTQETSGIIEDLYGVTYGDGLFVAVGDHGNVVISADGKTWIERTPDVGTTRNLSAVTYGKGTFIAVGDSGTVITSSNGYDWEARTYESTIFPYFPYGVAYGGNVFVAVGASVNISSSIDGVTWNERGSGTYSRLYEVAYGNGIFVAVGQMGEVLTSPDGITWQLRNSETVEDLRTISYGGCANTFVAIACTFINTAFIFTSVDGIAWTKGFFQIRDFIYGSAFGNGTFVVVGSKIFQSDPLSGNCTATLSSDLSLHVPIINFDGHYLWCDATCGVDADGSGMCMVTNYGAANPADFSTCEVSTVSSNLELHIPFCIYNNLSFQADFEYVPTTDGQIWFKLVGASGN